MQTPTLPIQISGASANPTPPRANANANAGADAQFSQALSREIEQRQASKPAPAAAPAPAKSAQATIQQGPQADQAGKEADAAPATSETGRPAAEKIDTKADAKADRGEASDTEAPAADASVASPAEMAALAPVVDMLALVASFNQPVQARATPVQEAPSAALGAAAGAAAGVAVAVTAAVVGDAGAAKAGAALAGQLAPSAAPEAALGAPPAAPSNNSAAFQLPAAVKALFKDDTSQQDIKLDPRGGLKQSAAGAGRPAVAAAPVAAAASPAAAAPVGAEPALNAARAAAPKVQTDLAQFAVAAREGASDLAAIKETPAGPAPVLAQAGQASFQIAQAVAGVAGDKIAARVGTPGWDNQVGQKIVWMVAGKEQSASLTLNPPDMGPMQVVLSVNNDQATVTFTSAQPEVRQALENAMPRLREMMSENGISLGDASVSAGTPDQRQAQAEQQRQAGQSGRLDGNGNNNSNGSAADAAARSQARGERAGLVDTFA